MDLRKIDVIEFRRGTVEVDFDCPMPIWNQVLQNYEQGKIEFPKEYDLKIDGDDEE
jgi:hypothetical protein